MLRRFKAVLFRIGVIQNEIDSEQRTPRPDSLRLLRLKRLRLALKDRLHSLSQSLTIEGEARRVPVIAAQRAPRPSRTDLQGGAR